MISAQKDRLMSFFQGNIQFIVPFFQRSYVWDEDNWNTLWEHTVSVLERAEKGLPGEHFIGTIIAKQQPAQWIGQSAYDLIDGQQRLTTIALLLKAIGDTSSDQMPKLKDRISEHLRFQDARGTPYPRLVHSRYDKPYYDAVIERDGLDSLPAGDHRILKAYAFFRDKLSGFTDDGLDLLRRVILERVPAISMILASDDDEQEIFDTINALGVRLTTGELLKNHIFKDKDAQDLFPKYWQDVFEDTEDRVNFWNSEKTAGRIIRTNIEVLLYCYLIIKTRSDIKLESLFKEYKKWLHGKSTEDKVAFLKELKKYAEIYYFFPSGTDLNQIGFNEEEKRFFHIVENLMVTTIYPLVLYIYKNITNPKTRNDLLRTLESYLIRRNVCRLTTKNYNLLFIQMINKLEEARSKIGEVNIQSLAEVIRGFDDPTNIMPTDGDFEAAFKSEILSNQNAREILFLLALYQISRGLADVPQLSLGNYSVEHMMPIKWEANWLDREMNVQEKADRNRKLKTLGNLTLVTKRLNSTMQNSAWSDKKEHLRKNSSLRITVDYLDKEKWDETCIDERAEQLGSAARSIWKWIGAEPPKIS
jgi:uncharacterized protein with ParB-like and HNH nuclease domain